MKQHIIISGLLIILLVAGFSGCLDEKNKFIGTWEAAEGLTTFTFKADDTVVITGTGPLGIGGLVGTANYSLADQKITFSKGSLGVTWEYSFPEDNKLILTSTTGGSLILTKVPG